MSLLAAVERLIEANSWSPRAQISAESLRLIAERIDSGSASDAVSAQLHRELVLALDRVGDGADVDGAPRIGLLRGEQALNVAIGLGFPEPEAVDMDGFDGLEAIRLKRARRLAGLPPQPALDRLIRAATARAAERRGVPGGAVWEADG